MMSGLLVAGTIKGDQKTPSSSVDASSLLLNTSLQVTIVSLGSNQYLNDLIEGIREGLAAKEAESGSRVVVTHVTSEFNFRATKQRSTNQLIIAVGPRALRSVLEAAVPHPILSVYSTRQQYQDIAKILGPHMPGMTAIYADSAPMDQMNLIKSIYQKGVKAGILLSEETLLQRADLEKDAKEVGISLTFAMVNGSHSLNDALQKLYRDNAQVVLALPDQTIFNIQNIRQILLTTYRHDQGIIGFSDGLVRSGALATVYSGPEHVASEVSSMVDTYLTHSVLKSARHASHYDVTINKYVARSLNLINQTPSELVAKIKSSAHFQDETFELVFDDRRK